MEITPPSLRSREGPGVSKKNYMQQNTAITNPDMEEENFTFRMLIQKWFAGIRYALRFWRVLLVSAIIGALLGLGYAWLSNKTFTARLTFVVEESKSGGGSIASALAGQIGFDVGSLTGTSGILAGDNVLELLKSYSLMKKTLLTPYRDSSTVSLADQYAEVYGLKEKWRNSRKVGKQISFPANQKQFSRVEDSLMHTIMEQIAEKELSITKPDKKLGFFELRATTRDERFSQLFCERLLKITTDFYIDTKTKRLSNNVYRLQRRADSLGNLLDRRTYSAAEADRLLLDANPAYSSPVVNAEINSRNKFIQSTVYGEIIKNLEVSKTALVQETPTVQIVDYPELPLKLNKVSWALSFLTGALVALLISILYFASRDDKQYSYNR